MWSLLIAMSAVPANSTLKKQFHSLTKHPGLAGPGTQMLLHHAIPILCSQLLGHQIDSAMWKTFSESVHNEISTLPQHAIVSAPAAPVYDCSSASTTCPRPPSTVVSALSIIKPKQYLSEGQYRHLDHDSLVRLMLHRDSQLKCATRELRAQARKASDQSSLLEVRKTDGKAESFQLAYKGVKERYFTVQSGLSVALRRNFGNVSAKDFGAVVLADVSGKTVCRWEVTLNASLVAAAQNRHNFAEECCKTSPTVSISVYSFSTDATNTNIWQHAKLHCLELWSGYLPDITSAMSQSLLVVMDAKRQWADTQRVVDASAWGTLGMIKKQLKSLGAPVWDSGWAFDVPIVDHPMTPPRFDVDGPPSHITLWMISTDGGSDQMKGRKLMKIESCWTVCHLIFDTSCMFHVGHLSVRTGLKRSDVWAARLERPGDFNNSSGSGRL
jgi:hypothetical protein